jgi:hypothetical protein
MKLFAGFHGRLNGEVLFDGGDGGLWVTNGTAPGTYELTGVIGAAPGGLSYGFDRALPSLTAKCCSLAPIRAANLGYG